MTLRDLLEVLQSQDRHEALDQPVRVRVWEHGNREPLLSNCKVIDVSEMRGEVIIDVEVDIMEDYGKFVVALLARVQALEDGVIETERLHSADCHRQEAQRQTEANALQAGFDLGTRREAWADQRGMDMAILTQRNAELLARVQELEADLDKWKTEAERLVMLLGADATRIAELERDLAASITARKEAVIEGRERNAELEREVARLEDLLREHAIQR